MARHSNPWFRSARHAWYVKINGKQRFLGEHPDGAPKPKKSPKGEWNAPDAIREEFHRIMVAPVIVQSGTVWAVFDAFLEHSEGNNERRTYEFYQERLQRFKDDVPNMRVEALSPTHVYNWMKGRGWSDNYKRGVITSLCRAFNWASKEARTIGTNPLRGIKKPPESHRETTISPAEFKNILRLVKDDAFRDVLEVVWLTGCRPFEAARIEARWVHNGLWEFPVKKSKGKKQPRRVHLVPKAERITNKWAKRFVEGPIFRNTDGMPWTASAFNSRFWRLRDKVGKKFCMYAIRHSYAHHAITKGGLTLEETAALLGHRSTATVFKVYGHLQKSAKFMQSAARRALTVR